MSLSDTDKTGDTRGTPSLNTVDGMAVPMAHATSGIAYRTENNSETAARVISKDDQIIVFDGSFNKALLGRDDSGNYVVKVAKDGFDVLTAANDELIFNSAQNVFKIVGSGTFSLNGAYSHGTGPQNSTLDSVVVAHNLGFKPGVVIYAYNPIANDYHPAADGSIVQQSVGIGFSSTYNFCFIRSFSVDSTNLYAAMQYKAYLSTGSTSGSLSETYKYYLLQETAN